MNKWIRFHGWIGFLYLNKRCGHLDWGQDLSEINGKQFSYRRVWQRLMKTNVICVTPFNYAFADGWYIMWIGWPMLLNVNLCMFVDIWPTNPYYHFHIVIGFFYFYFYCLYWEGLLLIYLWLSLVNLSEPGRCTHFNPIPFLSLYNSIYIECTLKQSLSYKHI